MELEHPLKEEISRFRNTAQVAAKYQVKNYMCFNGSLKNISIPSWSRRRFDLTRTDGFWKVASVTPENGGEPPRMEGISKVMFEVKRDAAECFLSGDHDEVMKVVSRGVRRKLEQEMKSRTLIAGRLKSGTKTDIAEVFSVPRVTKVAAAEGMVIGTAIDLKLGDDLLSSSIQAKTLWQIEQNDDPYLTVLSPPCTMHCALNQRLNKSRMDPMKWRTRMRKANRLFDFACLLAERRHRQGRRFLLEHPWSATSWRRRRARRLMKLLGHGPVRADMCAFGMKVGNSEYFNKKPTGLLTNDAYVEAEVGLRCSCVTPHTWLVNGKPTLAEVYPPSFCQAIIRGVRKSLEACAAECCFHGPAEVDDGGDQAEQVLEGGGENQDDLGEADAKERAKKVEESTRRLIQKCHENCGHPARRDFLRLLRLAKAKQEVLDYVKYIFECPSCASRVRPQTRRPSAVPKTFRFNALVGLDTIFIDSVPYMNVVCWGTSFQMVQRMNDNTAESAWESFVASWVRTMGLPETIITDGGSEFAGQFAENAQSRGLLHHVTDANAPWQNGKTERHGALFKELLAETRSLEETANQRELDQCIAEVVGLKNRTYHRSGFSPHQRVFGSNPRVPNSLLSDDALDDVSNLEIISGIGEYSRAARWRDAARKAFAEFDSKERVKRMMNAGWRHRSEFKGGDLVYVWRRSRQSSVAVGRWHGPGVCLLCRGTTVWVSVRGRLWKCAKEQVRKATKEEEDAFHLLPGELEELRSAIGNKEHQLTQVDVSGEGGPPEEDDEAPVAASDVGALPPQDHSTDTRSGNEEVRQVEVPQNVPPPLEAGRERDVVVADMPSTPQSSSAGEPQSSSAGEPMAEPSGQETLEADESRTGKRPPAESPEDLRVEVEAEERCAAADHEQAAAGSNTEELTLAPTSRPAMIPGSLLDDVPLSIRGGSSSSRGRENISVLGDGDTVREHVKQIDSRSRPYFGEGEGGDAEDQCWLVSEMIQGLREKQAMMNTQVEAQSADEDRCSNEYELWENGFYVNYFANDKTHFFAPRRRNAGEVSWNDLDANGRAAFTKSDVKEWTTIKETKAVTVFGPEAAKKILEKIPVRKILRSRMVRRWKPGEGVGAPATAKSRWCVLGFECLEDVLSESYSPTPQTASLQVVLQIVACHGWHIVLGDAKNAFCQSAKSDRPDGHLYAWPCQGVPEAEGSLIRLDTEVYGLIRAPLHWRQTITETIKKLGYSKCRFDPCVWFLRQEGKLHGVIILEVDDLLMAGDEVHASRMTELRHTFEFGKWRDIFGDIGDFAGRQIQQNVNGMIEVHQEKFITERLKPVMLSKARRLDKSSRCSPDEHRAFRGIVGSLLWAARESRPDLAGSAVALSTKLQQPVIDDIIKANKVCKVATDLPRLPIRIWPLSISSITWVTIGDASWANGPGGKTQGGYIIGTSTPALESGAVAPVSLLCWRSSHFKRKVPSTLSAETQSLSDGLAECNWLRCVWNDIVVAGVTRDWRAQISASPALAVARSGTELQQIFSKVIAVTDARCLYDQLSRDCPGIARDRRCAIDMCIIKEELEECNGKVRWVDHPAMPVDALTKLEGNLECLQRVMATGCYSLKEEGIQLLARSCMEDLKTRVKGRLSRDDAEQLQELPSLFRAVGQTESRSGL